MFRPNVAKSVAKIWLACGHLQECGKMEWECVARSLEKIWLACGQECGKMEWQCVARSLANVWQHKVKSVAKYSDISSGVGQLVLNGQGA